RRKPDIPVPYLYVDMGVAVLCASFMSFGVKRRWFALGAALQLAVATYVGTARGQPGYSPVMWDGDTVPRRTVPQIVPGGSLRVGQGSVTSVSPRTVPTLSPGQHVPTLRCPRGVPAVSPQAYSLQHSTEDRLAYLDHLLGGELALQLLFLLYGLLALAFLSGCYVRAAAQVLAVLLPPAILLIDGNLRYWHALRRVEFWNQMKLIGQNVGIFGAVVILATDG
ncbi:TM101 protein, partial [Leiothrix lutea]|nr:TM101 protein [Leiothrix lutea]